MDGPRKRSFKIHLVEFSGLPMKAVFILDFICWPRAVTIEILDLVRVLTGHKLTIYCVEVTLSI